MLCNLWWVFLSALAALIIRSGQLAVDKRKREMWAHGSRLGKWVRGTHAPQHRSARGPIWVTIFGTYPIFLPVFAFQFYRTYPTSFLITL